MPNVDSSEKTTTPGAAPRRFMFDQSFDVVPRPKKKKKPEEEKPPEPTFSREELEAARQDGYAQGHAAGVEETASGVGAEVMRLVAAISEQLPGISAMQAEANERLMHDGTRVVSTIARKILPAYTARHGLGEVEALVTRCLGMLVDQPKITVRVGATRRAAISEQLDAAAAASAFDGRFLVETDDAMGPSDCRMLWQGGGLERSEVDIWRQVDAAIGQYLAELVGGASPGRDDTPNETVTDREPAADVADAAAASDAADTLDRADLADMAHSADPAPTNAADAPTGASSPLEDR